MHEKIDTNSPTLEDFKQYLNDDADDQTRDAAKQVYDGLEGLRLEAKMRAVASERRMWIRRKIWWWATVGAILTILSGSVFLLFLKKETPSNLPNLEKTPPPVVQQPISTPPQQAPIAKRNPTPDEKANRPQLRSVQPDLDSTTIQLVEFLLNITERNESALIIYPNNERVNHKKAIDLLRKYQPAAAKKEIFQIEISGEASWLLGIALLEEGKIEDAQAIFERIARDPGNPRSKHAIKALEALR